MEGLPNNESILTKQELINRIKQEGLESGVLDEIIKWRELKESEVVTARDSVVLNVDMLEFYAASGKAEDAYEDAVQTLYSARFTDGCDDLVEKILAIYPELDSVITVEQVDKGSDQ